jgi:hypothetical protein
MQPIAINGDHSETNSSFAAETLALIWRSAPSRARHRRQWKA